MDKQKNGINQDLRSLFEQNPTEWFTNDQLAERLQKPVISVRNALSKTKWNGEVLTRLTGCIEFRAWHTASFDEPLPITDVQKRIAARTCNSCQTSFSRYWRSDLLAPGFLCNNCGMNQRRGQNPKQRCVCSDLAQQRHTILSLPMKNTSQIMNILMEAEKISRKLKWMGQRNYRPSRNRTMYYCIPYE